MEELMMIAGGALLLVGIGLIIFLGFKTGWKFPKSFEEAKEHGWAGILAFICVGAGLALLASFASSGESNKDRRKREEMEGKRREDEHERSNIRTDAAVEQDRADRAGIDSDRADSEAEEHRARAAALGEEVTDAGDRAEDALARADRIRAEREES